MSVLDESRIRFDFSRATSVTKHDDRHGDGNGIWPGVDFRIQESQGWIWLEVKNWDPTHIAAKYRGGNRWSFMCKMRRKAFTKDVREKFVGTTAFLTWKNIFPLVPTQYVLLFQPPHPLDSALLVTFQTRLQSQLPNLRIWAAPMTVTVLDATEWNQRYPDYPAILL